MLRCGSSHGVSAQQVGYQGFVLLWAHAVVDLWQGQGWQGKCYPGVVHLLLLQPQMLRHQGNQCLRSLELKGEDVWEEASC